MTVPEQLREEKAAVAVEVAAVASDLQKMRMKKKKKTTTKMNEKEKQRDKDQQQQQQQQEKEQEEEEESEKKKKKKNRKKRENQMEEDEVEAVQETKKKKKRKASAMDSVEASSEAPAVEKRKKKGKKMNSEKHSDDNSSGGCAELAEPGMTAEQAREYRAERDITVSGPQNADRIFPLRNFAQLPLPAGARDAVAKFSKPTPIQSQCWPAVLRGRDVIGIAQTGSGKTLGFLLPLLPRLCELPALQPRSLKQRGPYCLILAPARELAIQTTRVCEEIGGACGLRASCIYGGVPKNTQVSELKRGCHIVTATPGRLLGLIQEGFCSLAAVKFLVLDEADRMLDEGFEQDIRALIGMTPSDRQTLLFSATWPRIIQRLAAEFVTEAVHITVGSAAAKRTVDDEQTDSSQAADGDTQQRLVANSDITQVVEVLDDTGRDTRLLSLLSEVHRTRTNRVLIFVLYKKEADRVEQMLHRRGWRHAVAISGDKCQKSRSAAIDGFRAGTCPLLIATDVASRGLDIPDVEYVINYSFPLTIEDYMHRIGRTGRAGKKGHAYTFFTKFNRGLAGELVGALRSAKQAVPEQLLRFGCAVKKKEHSMYGAHFRPDSDPAMAAKKPTRVVFD